MAGVARYPRSVYTVRYVEGQKARSVFWPGDVARFDSNVFKSDQYRRCQVTGIFKVNRGEAKLRVAFLDDPKETYVVYSNDLCSEEMYKWRMARKRWMACEKDKKSKSKKWRGQSADDYIYLDKFSDHNNKNILNCKDVHTTTLTRGALTCTLYLCDCFLLSIIINYFN